MSFKALTYQIFRVFLLIAVLSISWGCKSSKEPITAEQLEALSNLQALLESKTYLIKINTVLPNNTGASLQVINAILVPNTGNTANRINVSGNNNYIKFNKDIITSELPFFGEQRLSSGDYLGINSGVNFEGRPKDYNVERHEVKRQLNVSFTTQQKDRNTESYNVDLLVYSNKTVRVTVISSHRTVINYLGTIEALEPIE